MKPMRVVFLSLVVAGANACGSAPPVAFSVTDRRVLPPISVGATSTTALDVAPEPLVLAEQKHSSDVKEARLPNGLRILVLERTAMPTESVALVIRQGSVHAKQGVAALYGSTLLGREEREQLFYLGADREQDVGSDAITVRAHALAPLTRSVIAAFARSLKRPGFYEGDLDDAKKQQRNELQESLESPTGAAGSQLRQAVFGAASPYATRTLGGTTASIDAIREEDLATFHAGVTGPNTTLAFAGPLPLAECVRIAGAYFSSLSAAKVPRAPTMTAPPTTSQITILDRPTASQSNIAIGFSGAAEGDERARSLEVVASMLARGLSGRLALKVRQEHGFSYGVSADNANYREAGIFTIESSVESSKTAESIASIATELRTLGTSVPAKTETTRAATAAAGESVQDQQTNERALNALVYLGTYDISLAEFERRPGLGSITPEMVQRGVSQTLDMSKAQIVIVGDAAKIEKSVRDLNLGPVKVVKMPAGSGS
jgi:zinc protease